MKKRTKVLWGVCVLLGLVSIFIFCFLYKEKHSTVVQEKDVSSFVDTLPKKLAGSRILNPQNRTGNMILYVYNNMLYTASLCNLRVVPIKPLTKESYITENNFFISNFFTDSTWWYTLTNITSFKVSDPETLELVVGEYPTNRVYLKDSKKAYQLIATSSEAWSECAHKNTSLEEMSGVDQRSFVKIAELSVDVNNVLLLMKDNKHVYLNDQIVSELDVKTFRLLGTPYQPRFFVDLAHIYEFDVLKKQFYPLVVVGDTGTYIDPNLETIKLSEEPNVLSDGSYYYTYTYHVPGTLPKPLFASPIAQNLLSIMKYSGYMTNESSVYFGKAKRVVGADSASFSIITEPHPGYLIKDDSVGGYDYAKDKRAVYYKGSEVIGADVNTFVPIAMSEGGYHWFGKDAKNVFVGEKIIPGADPQTFEILWYPIYEGCGPGFFSKDAAHVFFENKIISGADPDTFEIVKGVGGPLGHDKNGYYDGTQYLGPTYDKKKYECNYG